MASISSSSSSSSSSSTTVTAQQSLRPRLSLEERQRQQLHLHATLIAARSRMRSLVAQYHLEQAERREERARAALEDASGRQPGPPRRRRRYGAGRSGAAGLDEDVQQRLKDGDAFLTACRTGRMVRVRAFLQNGGDANAALLVPADGAEGPGEPRHGQTTHGLLEAVGAGHLEVAAKLLACDAKTTVRRGADGETPLHLAVRCQGDPRMVQLLMRVKADVAARTTVTDRTPLVVLAAAAAAAAAADEAPEGEGGKGSSSSGSSAPPSPAARVRMVALLLDAGADPDAKDAAGWTAAQYARRAGDSALLRAVMVEDGL
jgi:hypothetical protein